MDRFLTILLIVLIPLAGIAALFGYLAYGIDEAPPTELSLPGLAGAVEIDWYDDGPVAIRAEEEIDALAALGFVHGLRHGWTLLLWRQTALGSLGTWFGTPLLPVDEVARLLGLSEQARAAYSTLDEPSRERLQAYARGVNAALGRTEARLQDHVAVLGIETRPWEPWHALAVERLLAWTAATPFEAPDSARAGPELRDFLDGDQLLREWLHLHGFEHSQAWIVHTEEEKFFYQRHVYGDAARPFVQEVDLSIGGSRHARLATVPGTLLFPGGQTTERAWGVLLSSPRRLTRSVSSNEVPTRHLRLYDEAGNERLVAYRRTREALWFDAPDGVLPPAPVTVPDTASAAYRTGVPAQVGVPSDSLRVPADSIWVVSWTGFADVTDVDAWWSLLRDEQPAFRLLRGDGLALGRDGAETILGAPSVQRGLRAGVLVANTPWALEAAGRLDSLLLGPAPLDPSEWTRDSYSRWAARIAPEMLASLNRYNIDNELLKEAVTYLRNWDFSYRRASIAASIFDRWMSAYLSARGSRPLAMGTDSSAVDHALRFRLLATSVQGLVEEYGPDLRQWRWERVSPGVTYYPGWSFSGFEATAPPLSETRYAPLRRPGDGHPSTLNWGPSPVLLSPPAPSVWSAWVRTSDWATPMILRPNQDVQRFLGRYLLSEDPAEPGPFTPPSPARHTTRLHP